MKLLFRIQIKTKTKATKVTLSTYKINSKKKKNINRKDTF